MPKLDGTHLPHRLEERLADLNSDKEVAARDVKALLSDEQIAAMDAAWEEQQELRKVKRARTKEEEKELGWKTKREIYIEAEFVVKMKDGDEYYLDPATRVSSDPYVRVIFIINHPELQEAAGVEYLSQVRETEFDCKTHRKRSHQVTSYMGPWGVGLISAQYYSKWGWEVVEKGSYGEIMLRAACAGLYESMSP